QGGDGPVVIEDLELLVDEVRQIGALPAAHAVVLLGEADGVGQVGVAGALADHGAGHEQVHDTGVGGAGVDLHQGGGLVAHRHAGEARLLGGGLAGGTGPHREVQLRQALHRLVVLGDAALEHHHLGIGGVGVGGGGAARDLIGDGHAVPQAVHRPALQLHELVVPVDDAELHLHAQGLGHLAGHVGVKAGPLAVLVLVVHGGELGDANHQGALVLYVRH